MSQLDRDLLLQIAEQIRLLQTPPLTTFAPSSGITDEKQVLTAPNVTMPPIPPLPPITTQLK